MSIMGWLRNSHQTDRAQGDNSSFLKKKKKNALKMTKIRAILLQYGSTFSSRLHRCSFIYKPFGGGNFFWEKEEDLEKKKVKNDGGEAAEGYKVGRSRHSRPAEWTPAHLIPWKHLTSRTDIFYKQHFGSLCARAVSFSTAQECWEELGTHVSTALDPSSHQPAQPGQALRVPLRPRTRVRSWPWQTAALLVFFWGKPCLAEYAFHKRRGERVSGLMH